MEGKPREGNACAGDGAQDKPSSESHCQVSEVSMLLIKHFRLCFSKISAPFFSFPMTGNLGDKIVRESANTCMCS